MHWAEQNCIYYKAVEQARPDGCKPGSVKCNKKCLKQRKEIKAVPRTERFKRLIEKKPLGWKAILQEAFDKLK